MEASTQDVFSVGMGKIVEKYHYPHPFLPQSIGELMLEVSAHPCFSCAVAPVPIGCVTSRFFTLLEEYSKGII